MLAVVGRSTEDRAEALEGLLAEFLLGGPLVLVLSSLLTYELTAAALRPVESMRREAEVIGAGDQPRRLPVPSADDEISRLATTLNEMLDRLEASSEENGPSWPMPATSSGLHWPYCEWKPSSRCRAHEPSGNSESPSAPW